MDNVRKTTDIWFKIFLTLKHKINPFDWDKNNRGKSVFLYKMNVIQWKNLKREFLADYIIDIKYELERTKDLIY